MSDFKNKTSETLGKSCFHRNYQNQEKIFSAEIFYNKGNKGRNRKMANNTNEYPETKAGSSYSKEVSGEASSPQSGQQVA